MRAAWKLGWLLGGGMLLALSGRAAPAVPQAPAPPVDAAPAPDVRRAQATPGPEIALPGLVDLALSSNPLTRQAWDFAKAGAANAQAARSEYYPTLDFEAVGMARYFQEPDFPGKQAVNQLYGGPGLALSYLLLDFGGRDARVAMAQAEMQAADSQFRQVVQDTLLEVLTAYAQVATARAALDAAEAALAYQQLNFASVQTGLGTGLNIPADLLTATSQVEQARGQLQAARGMVASALGALNTACGRKANVPLNPAALPHKLTITQVDQSVDALIQQSLRSRPEIAVSFAEVRVRDEAVRNVESTYWPTVTFDMEGYYAPDASRGTKLGINFNEGYAYGGASVGITIEWELFDGFYRENKVKAARADADAARNSLRQTQLATVREVWDAYYEYLTAARDLLFREAARKAVDAQLDIAEGGLSTGLISDVQLASAIADQRMAVAAETRARSIWLTSAVRLIYTTGRLSRETLAR